MGSQWVNVVVDAEDPPRLARWWAEALGYQIIYETSGRGGDPLRARPDARADLRPGAGGEDGQEPPAHRPAPATTRTPRSSGWSTWVPGTSTSGRPTTSTWVVLADPEGNEFCVLLRAGVELSTLAPLDAPG